MRLTSATEKPAALRRGLSYEWRTPPAPDEEEDSEGTGNELEVSSQPKKYIRGAISQYPDFHRVMQAADRAGHQIPEPAASAIRSMPDSDRIHIVYHLGTHPKEIRKLHKLPPEARTSRVHELLSQLNQRQEPPSGASLPMDPERRSPGSSKYDARCGVRSCSPGSST